MKKVIEKLFLTVIFCLATALVFSACTTAGGGNSDNTEVREYGVWNEYDGVKLAYVSEKDAPKGKVKDKKVFPELTCKAGESYYMVVDFAVQAPTDNDGSDMVDVIVQVKPTAVIKAELQQASSEDYTDTTVDGVQQIKVNYGIPDKSETVRNIRLLIRLGTLQISEAYLEVFFVSDAGVKAVQTERIEQTANIGFTQGMTYELIEDKYTVTSFNRISDGAINVPLFKDGLEVEAISGNVVCEREYAVIKHVSDAGRALTLHGKLLLNEAKKEVVFGCGTGEIPSDITRITDYAYAGCEELKSFSVPQRITAIGEGAFYKCNNLTSFELALTSVNYSDIGRSVFGYIFANKVPESLKSVNVLGDTVVKNAFLWCDKIENITLSDEVTSMGSHAFYGCHGLQSIKIPDKLTAIEGNTFEECKGLKSIDIPSSIKSIGSSTFRGCSGLTTVTVPDTVVELGWGAFYECSGLISVTLPKNLTEIADFLFSDCRALTTVNIPNTVKSIGANAFYNCKNVEITYGGTKADWSAVEKGSEWDKYCVYTVYCTDGTIQKEQD